MNVRICKCAPWCTLWLCGKNINLEISRFDNLMMRVLNNFQLYGFAGNNMRIHAVGGTSCANAWIVEIPSIGLIIQKRQVAHS